MIMNIEYHSPDNSNSPFHAGAYILNLLLLYELVMFFRV